MFTSVKTSPILGCSASTWSASPASPASHAMIPRSVRASAATILTNGSSSTTRTSLGSDMAIDAEQTTERGVPHIRAVHLVDGKMEGGKSGAPALHPAPLDGRRIEVVQASAAGLPAGPGDH